MAPKDIFFRDTDVCTEFYSYDDEYGDPDSEAVYVPDYTIMPKDSYGKIKWKSSNTSIGKVDGNGKVTLLKPGRIKITATLPSGKSRSYYLTILKEGEYPGELDSVRFKKTSVKMYTGSYKQLVLIKSPKPVPENYIEWITTNPNVLTVDDNGVVTARNPGKAIVIAINRDSFEVLTCKVTVKPSKAWKIKKVKASKPSVKAKALKKNKVKLTWKRVPYASGYYVYKASKAKGKYKKIAKIKGSRKCKLVIRKIKKAKKCYFKVRAYLKIGKKTYRGKLSKAVKAKK